MDSGIWMPFTKKGGSKSVSECILCSFCFSVKNIASVINKLRGWLQMLLDTNHFKNVPGEGPWTPLQLGGGGISYRPTHPN